MTRLGGDGAQVFFGYHDKVPFDPTGTRVLAHRVGVADPTHPDAAGAVADVGYFTLDEPQAPAFIRLGATAAWSWQQGSMLQWDPVDPGRRILFNVLDRDAGALVCDVVGGEAVERLPLPVYAVSATGRLVVSLNFARLARLRPGYGHPRQADPTADDPAPAGDGLMLLDRGTGRSSLVADLRDLASGVRSAGHHYVNHATFSPDETRLAFFHVWAAEDGRRRIRLFVADVVSGDRRLLEDDRLVSHYCWLDSGRLLVTTRDAALRWRYSVYDVAAGTRTDLNLPVAMDGHPMRCPDNPRLVVSDTTPDARRRQHLLLLDLDRSTVAAAGVWTASERLRGPIRCDLHPRWDRAGRQLCVDVAPEGRREMLVLAPTFTGQAS